MVRQRIWNYFSLWTSKESELLWCKSFWWKLWTRKRWVKLSIFISIHNEFVKKKEIIITYIIVKYFSFIKLSILICFYPSIYLSQSLHHYHHHGVPQESDLLSPYRGVLSMTLNCICWWGTSSGALGSVE